MERFNRRQLLLLVPGAAVLAAACKSEPHLPEQPSTRRTVPARPFRDHAPSVSNFDSRYLQSLLDILERPKGNIGERVKAVEDNLVGISNGLTSQGIGVVLDESGYFLTVAHNVFSPLAIDAATSTLIQPLPAVWGLRAGLVYPIKAIGVSYENDLAVVYAPTGLPRRPIPNLQISTQRNTEMGSKRWLITMEIPGKNQPNQLVISSGSKRPKESPITITGPFQSQEVLKDAYLVDGIVSLPGLSGSPIVDKDGVIESVLRGRLMQTNQRIAVAIPLSGLRTLEYTSL